MKPIRLPRIRDETWRPRDLDSISRQVVLTDWKVERIPGVIVRVYQKRLMIRVQLAGSEKVVMGNPENALDEESADLRPAPEVGAVCG